MYKNKQNSRSFHGRFFKDGIFFLLLSSVECSSCVFVKVSDSPGSVMAVCMCWLFFARTLNGSIPILQNHATLLNFACNACARYLI